MGPILELSWLVRAQVGAKRGKLTLLGGLRGTKLEFKGALEAPPREPKSATSYIDSGPVGVYFAAGGPRNKYLSKLRYC